MAVDTFYSSVNSGNIASEDVSGSPSYTAARAGTGNSGIGLANTGGGGFALAVNGYVPPSGKSNPYYACLLSYSEWDVSSVGTDTINSATLSFRGFAPSFFPYVNSSTAGMSIEAYSYDFGNYVQAGASISSQAQVNATSGTTLISGNFTVNNKGLLVISTVVTGGSLPTLSISDTYSGLSWTQLSASSGNTRTSIFYAQLPAGAQTGTVTVTSSVTIVDGILRPICVNGCKEVNPVLQTATTNLSGTTAASVATTLGSAPAANSMVISLLGLQWGATNQTLTTPTFDGHFDMFLGTVPKSELYFGQKNGSGAQTNTFSWTASTLESGGLVTLEIAPDNDFIPGASQGALTKLATYAMNTGANWSTAAYNDFTETSNNLKTAIATAAAGSGKLRIAVSTDLMRLGTVPTGNNNATSYGSTSGAGFAPKLVVDHSAAGGSSVKQLAALGVG